MNIELAPESDLRMSYNDAILYCFSFNIDGKIGWRMPTFNEYLDTRAMGWYLHDDLRFGRDLYPVTPVRDIIDD
jgi:hypothetical protein